MIHVMVCHYGGGVLFAHLCKNEPPHAPSLPLRPNNFACVTLRQQPTTTVERGRHVS